MRILKKVASDLLFYLLWAVIAALLWIWIFSFITNTSVDKKVVLFADVPVIRATELSIELEKDKPENIKMVKAKSFENAMMMSSEIAVSDMYIVGSEAIDKYFDSFAPLSGEYVDSFDADVYAVDGVIYGIKVFDKESGKGIAMDYIGYYTDEDYYLFFGVRSAHCKSLGFGDDDAALSIARRLFEL